MVNFFRTKTVKMVELNGRIPSRLPSKLHDLQKTSEEFEPSEISSKDKAKQQLEPNKKVVK